LDKDLRIKSANRTFYETFQTEPEKVIGSRITDILGDEDGRLSAELTRLFGTGDMLENLQLLYQSEILGERIFNVTARGMLVAEEEEEEEEEEELVVLQDITIRERAEEALRESEEKYRSLVESTEDSIYLVDRDCRYLFVNNTHLSRIGLSMEEIRGRRYGELHSEEEDTKEFAERVEEVFETGKSVPHEHRSRRDNRYFLRTFSPVNDSEGRTTAVTVVSKDITERKLAEEALRESEEKYRSLIDQSQDVIYLFYEGKFELINRRFEELFGYTLEEVNAPDFQFMNLVAPRSRALVEERAEKVYRGEAVPPQYEFTALTRDGAELEVETSVSYIEYKEGIAVQGIVRDITQRKQAERRIEHLNLVLRAIRNVNQLITREKDRDRLLKGICETLIETRGYHHAWIAIFDESGGLVTTAQAGLDILPLVEYLRRGELPVCAQRALQQSGIVVMEEAPSDCADYPLAAEHPGTMTMTVRLAHAGKVYGVLNVSLVPGLNAHEEEEALFEEVAGDIALALHDIELEEEHKRMQRDIEERQEYLASVLKNAPDAIVTFDAANRIVEWNPGAEWLFGYTYDEAVGRDIDDVVARPDVRERAILFTEQLLSGKEIPPTEVVRYRKDGTPVSVILAGSPIIIGDELRGGGGRLHRYHRTQAGGGGAPASPRHVRDAGSGTDRRSGKSQRIITG
ncbi:PAS domain S-box protein, partial [Dehalococcoidia bacterium]|nr:PAS domain S-box protein [Dehalococcoidia bacterium]